MASNSRGKGDGAASGKGKGKLGRWLIMLIGLVVVAAGAGGGWYYWKHKRVATVAPPPQPIYVVIKPFVVTMLDDNQTSRFVQVGVDLEVADKDAEKKVDQVLPAIQDAIRLQILQSKVSVVTTPQGVEQLRKALIVQANHTIDSLLDPPPDPHAPKPKAGTPAAPMPEPVHNLYFTELVVE